MAWQYIIPAAASFLGNLMSNNALGGVQDMLQNLPGQSPINVGGPLGFSSGETGQSQFSPEFAALQSALTGSVPSLFSGGQFLDSTDFQNALADNNIAGAAKQADSNFAQGFSQFFNQGNFANLGTGTNSLFNTFANNLAGGPQDLSGGLMQNLFSQGGANLTAAGDTNALRDSALATFRAQAQPATDRLFNQLQNRLFSTGQLGSTGGAQQVEGFFNAVNQQDLGFQNAAIGAAQNEASFLSNLGQGQLSLGQGFQSQNLQKFFNDAVQAQNFGQLGTSIEGQGFQQLMNSQLARNSAGLQRLNAATGLLGLGNTFFNDAFNLGLGSSGQMVGLGNLGLQLSALPYELQASLLGSSGGIAEALAGVGSEKAGVLGGMISGLGSLGEIFA